MKKVAGTKVPEAIAPAVKQSFIAAAVVSGLYLLFTVLAVAASSSNMTQLAFYLLFGILVPLCGWCGAKRQHSRLIETFSACQGAAAACSVVLLIVLWVGVGSARALCQETVCVDAFASGNTTCSYTTDSNKNAGGSAPDAKVGRAVRMGNTATELVKKEGVVSKEFCESGHDWFTILGTLLLIIHVLLATIATVFACRMKEAFRLERVSPTTAPPKKKEAPGKTVELAAATIIYTPTTATVSENTNNYHIQDDTNSQ